MAAPCGLISPDVVREFNSCATQPIIALQFDGDRLIADLANGSQATFTGVYIESVSNPSQVPIHTNEDGDLTVSFVYNDRDPSSKQSVEEIQDSINIQRHLRWISSAESPHFSLKEYIKQMSNLTAPRRQIFVTFQKEGTHCYPAAATDPALATGGWDDVSFLASPHRHMFHFKVKIDVFHDDRDIEFIQFKRWLEGLFGDSEYYAIDIDSKSCEMLAMDLHEAIVQRYPNRSMSIEVNEDNENGAILTWER